MNGMLLGAGIGALFRRAHRHCAKDAFDGALQAPPSPFSARLTNGTKLLREARGIAILDPKTAVTELLRGERDLRPFLKPILAAYDLDPEGTRDC